MVDGIELSDVDGFGVDVEDGVGLVFGIVLGDGWGDEQNPLAALGELMSNLSIKFCLDLF